MAEPEKVIVCCVERRGSKSNTFHITVGTTALLLVKENPKRVGLLVYCNTSGAIAYILSAQNKAATDGIPVIYQQNYESTISKAEYWIIASGASTDVRVEEISE
jgi:hypothetical protein